MDAGPRWKDAMDRLDGLGDFLVNVFQLVALFVPVLFLPYVAITAITRFMAIDAKELPFESVPVGTGSILVLTLAVLVLQVAASRFPTPARGDQTL